MKKAKKMLSISALGLLLSALAAVGVSAASVRFYNSEVPKFQGYATVIGAKKTEASSYGLVRVSSIQGASAVTFSASSVSANKYGPGAIVQAKQLSKDYAVQYTEHYAKDTVMMARYRNHSWSFTRGFISGTFDYK